LTAPSSPPLSFSRWLGWRESQCPWRTTTPLGAPRAAGPRRRTPPWGGVGQRILRAAAMAWSSSSHQDFYGDGDSVTIFRGCRLI
jgi:hypothetical protein